MARGGIVDAHVGQAHAGIGQREDRHHAVRDPRVQGHLHPQDGRQEVTLRDAEVAQAAREAGRAVRGHGRRLEFASDPYDDRGRLLRRGTRQHGRHEAEHDAGQRGMRPRLQQPQPQQHTRHHVGIRGPDTQALHADHHHDRRRREREPGVVEPSRVEERDDEHGHDVVDDRERQEEHAHRRWNATSQQRQHTHREGDVGGRGHRPSRALHGRQVQRKVDERGHRDAAQRCRHRQRRGAHVAQRSLVHLAADLHPDHEKEDRHQDVVDDEVQRLGHDERPHPDRHRGVPHGLIRGMPGRIGPGQGHRRRQQQHHAAHRLDVEKALDHVQRPGRGPLRGPRCGRARRETRHDAMLRHDVGPAVSRSNPAPPAGPGGGVTRTCGARQASAVAAVSARGRASSAGRAWPASRGWRAPGARTSGPACAPVPRSAPCVAPPPRSH